MENISRSEKINILLSKGIYTREELDLLQDSILNDLYLKHLVDTGVITKEESGKPWIQYYQDRPHKFLNTNASLYKNYVEANKDNPYGRAIYSADNDRIIKSNELIHLIDCFANGLLEIGINSESRAGVIALGSYEEPVCLLAPNKNGTLIKYLDYIKGPASMRADVEKSNIDILIMDEVFLQVENIINPKNVPVIVLNPTRNYDNTKYLTFDKVLNIGASSVTKQVTGIDNYAPSLIINSSGTTGVPKPIVHSNYTVNSSAQKKLFIDLPMTRNNAVFKVIPSHIAYGLINTMYSSLISGTTIILNHITEPNPDFKYTIELLRVFKQLTKKHIFSEDAQLMYFASPMFYRVIYDNIDLFDDLSFCGAFLAAGSKMTKEEIITLSQKFSEKNMNLTICNGYGQNELAGPVACNDISHNAPGSGGYPVIGTDVKVIDLDTLEEVPAGVEGRIIEKSDSEFLYYEGMETETKKSKIILPNGEEYFDTKDIGFFDENGFIYISGRASRVIIRNDLKLSMDSIEEKLKKQPAIKNCILITRKTKGSDDEHVAIIELKPEYEDVSREEIINAIKTGPNKLSPEEVPVDFRFVDEIPFLSNGKPNYQQASKDYHEKVLKL